MQEREDITIIIRSVGERTVPVIKHLLKQQVSEDQLFEVNEAPLSRALEVSYEFALKEGRRYVLIIDGDILPFRNMLDRLTAIFNKLDERVFGLQCSVADKMIHNFRPAGVHMHRTVLLESAMKQIPEANETVRPESMTINEMADRGYPTLFIDDVLALHDFEQYYKDLFRKSFFLAHKHTKDLPYVKKLWKRLAVDDNDYRIALEGLERGEQYNKRVVADIKQFGKYNISDILSAGGLTEKSELRGDEIGFDWIEKGYHNFNIPIEYYHFALFPSNHRKTPLKRRFLQLKAKVGLWRMGPWLIGNYIEKAGRLIKQKQE
jgi:hypothetical protein